MVHFNRLEPFVSSRTEPLVVPSEDEQGPQHLSTCPGRAREPEIRFGTSWVYHPTQTETTPGRTRDGESHSSVRSHVEPQAMGGGTALSSPSKSKGPCACPLQRRRTV